MINLPFYWFAWRRRGGEFTIKTFVAVSLLSAVTVSLLIPVNHRPGRYAVL